MLELSTALSILVIGLSALTVSLRHGRQLAARNGDEATALVALANAVERIEAEPSRRRAIAAEIIMHEVARCDPEGVLGFTPVFRETNGCVVAEVRGRSGQPLASVILKP